MVGWNGVAEEKCQECLQGQIMATSEYSVCMRMSILVNFQSHPPLRHYHSKLSSINFTNRSAYALASMALILAVS